MLCFSTFKFVNYHIKSNQIARLYIKATLFGYAFLIKPIFNIKEVKNLLLFLKSLFWKIELQH